MAKYDLFKREDEIKNLVRDDWFGKYDGNRSIGNIDFSVCMPTDPNQLEIFDLDFFLWAEAKKGNREDIDDSLVQLIMTIMKARTYNDYLPPLYLGAFDAEKIAFIPYDDKLQRQVIFDQVLENKIDWTSITPSDHTTEEFQLVKHKAKDVLLGKIIFDFDNEEKDLRLFIKSNFKAAKTGTNKINITLNRMTSIFNRWLEEVKPTIDVPWVDLAQQYNILPADFFLADVISKNNQSLGPSLQVLLRSNEYQVTKHSSFFGVEQKLPIGNVKFKDHQKAHKTFWNKYNRPPRRKERLQMQTRRDLLVEPDRRERKGAFFTPHQWVDLSQEYLANILGQKWQQEYYVWDCCAGTGNLLFGLTEKERIFASTLDEADVTYMKTQENLLPAHVFQFDFLNDDLKGDKVPEDLKRILNDPEERKKLVIYINPPYVEAGNKKITAANSNYTSKEGATLGNATYHNYRDILSKASNEIFAQFFIRIYNEIPSCRLAEFSKLKILQSPNFVDFRRHFFAKLESAFLVPANTFDNVTGKFPIGFFIWNTGVKESFKRINANVYDKDGLYIGEKAIYSYDRYTPISSWFFEILDPKGKIGHLSCRGSNDFQGSPTVSINSYLVTLKDRSQRRYRSTLNIDSSNLIKTCVFFSVRHCIEANWLNDRDQFLAPNHEWISDKIFHNDCLAYTLFHGQNRITSKEGKNNWIPFLEKEVSAPMLFESHFMSDFIAGKIKSDAQETLFGAEESLIPSAPIQFSTEAQAVMDAGRELWRYYMTKKDSHDFNVNASYYDIRRYFQGEKNGKMNPDSTDPTYMRLWGNIKEAQKKLAAKIAPKVYLYGFLLDDTTLPEDEPAIIDEPLPVKPAKRTPKPKAKPSSVTVINQIHIENFNHYQDDHSQHLTVKK